MRDRLQWSPNWQDTESPNFWVCCGGLSDLGHLKKGDSHQLLDWIQRSIRIHPLYPEYRSNVVSNFKHQFYPQDRLHHALWDTINYSFLNFLWSSIWLQRKKWPIEKNVAAKLSCCRKRGNVVLRFLELVHSRNMEKVLLCVSKADEDRAEGKRLSL